MIVKLDSSRRFVPSSSGQVPGCRAQWSASSQCEISPSFSVARCHRLLARTWTSIVLCPGIYSSSPLGRYTTLEMLQTTTETHWHNLPVTESLN